jgi:hypothetical protein
MIPAQQQLDHWACDHPPPLTGLSGPGICLHESSQIGATQWPDIVSEIEAVKAKVTDALRVAEQDDGASTVLVAVVRELAAKADKAGRGPGRDAVIELEQAGDSAKAAAEADSGAGARSKVSGAFGSLAGSEDRRLASGPAVCN